MNRGCTYFFFFEPKRKYFMETSQYTVSGSIFSCKMTELELPSSLLADSSSHPSHLAGAIAAASRSRTASSLRPRASRAHARKASKAALLCCTSQSQPQVGNRSAVRRYSEPWENAAISQAYNRSPRPSGCPGAVGQQRWRHVSVRQQQRSWRV